MCRLCTSEVWSSKVFPLVLREVSDDPRSGKHTRELVRLDLGEPDVSLFCTAPEDYEIFTVGVHQVTCDQWR